MQPEDLETIVQSWNPNKRPAPKDKLLARVLHTMYGLACSTHDVRIPINDVISQLQASVPKDDINSAINNLNTEGLIMKKYDPVLNKECAHLRAQGYEVFVPERETMEKIISSTYRLLSEKKWPEVFLQRLASEVGLGGYSITLYYLNRLGAQGVVIVDMTYKSGHKFTDIHLTEKGKRLAEYLKSKGN